MIQTEKTQTYKLYTFDIFDTLITRRVATPLGIFAIMQKELISNIHYSDIPEFIKKNFFTLRKESEIFTRQNKHHNDNLIDITFDDIYNTIKINNNLSDAQINKIKALEIQTEINNIVPIQKNINKLKELLSQGKNVLLISDMYLSETNIRKILISVDTVFKNIKIYVSNNFNKNKWDGELYKYVRDIEKIEYTSWKHFGDNLRSDYLNAKKMGINAEFISQVGFMPYEKYIWEYENNYYYQGLIGTARLARVYRDDNDIFNFAASFAAPILFGFVSWIIKNAISQKIKTLHFISRDGYILKEIADIIIKKKNIPLKVKYIYGSRKALRIPDLENYEKIVSWIFDEYPEKHTLSFIARRLNIDAQVLKKHFNIPINTLFNTEQRKYLKYIILNNTEIKNAVIKNNDKRKELCIKYFKQELDLSSERVVFVDANGSGRSQDILSNMFKNKTIITYYFACELNVKQSERCIKQMYYPICLHNVLIELLCRSPEGQTISYRTNKTGLVIPVMEQINKSLMKNWGIYDYINGVRQFTQYAIEFESINNIHLDYLDLYKNYLKFLFTDLDKHTANIMGSIPYSIIGKEKNITDCAPIFRIKDFIRILLRKEAINKEFEFISYKRSAKIFQNIVCIREKYGSIKRFLFSIHLNIRNKIFYIIIFGIKISFGSIFWSKKVF